MNPRLIDKFRMLHVGQTAEDFLAATTPYRETSEGSVAHYFSELGATDFRSNLLISIFFFVFFSGALSLCPVVHSELCTTEQSSKRGCPDRQGIAGISLIHKTFTQAGGQCMACKFWGGVIMSNRGKWTNQKSEAPGAQGFPPQSRVP